MNDWSSPLLDDGLTYGVSYERSTVGASVDEDTDAKSWMVGSPMMSGKNGGGWMEGSHPSLSVDAKAPTHTLHE